MLHAKEIASKYLYGSGGSVVETNWLVILWLLIALIWKPQKYKIFLRKDMIKDARKGRKLLDEVDSQLLTEIRLVRLQQPIKAQAFSRPGAVSADEHASTNFLLMPPLLTSPGVVMWVVSKTSYAAK